jgi:hypothetical protein
MRRISGVDINGWKDVAGRDWDPDTPEEIGNSLKILNGGIKSVAIQQSSAEWIGGPQALLAPHGRGLGWGALGGPERRASMSQLMEDLRSSGSKRFGVPFAAAVNALARGADDVILAVPDIPDVDESVQGRILSAFHQDRRAVRLLWRPVAAFLHALELNIIDRDADGALFCFLIHSSAGIELQTLRLRRDSEHRDHSAPERDGYGVQVFDNVGMNRLVQRAHRVVLDFNSQLEEGFCEESSLAARLICGGASTDEIDILRLHNGNWIEVQAPTINAEAFFTDADLEKGIDPGILNTTAATFFLTPLAETFAVALTARLKNVFPNLLMLEWDSVARGSLIAGRLIERARPHYFDRLTSISLAILKNEAPIFDDLVGSNTTLPANKEYISPPYRNLKWMTGKQDLEFYVLKGEREVRYWTIHLDEAPKRNVTVELRLRQTPGQSWAKLSLTSPEWEPLQRSPLFLDWDKLDPIEASPEAILAKLSAPPPTIPTRIVESASSELWTGSNRHVGLISVLEDPTRHGHFRADQIGNLLARSLRDPGTGAKSWTVGTDGILPDKLSSEDRKRFLGILAGCEKQILTALVAGAVNKSGPLRCLTWSFTLCPDRIQDEIVLALEADLSGRDHPLLALRRARSILTQGAGRSVNGVERLRRVLRVLASRSANNDTLSAFAMILSRRADAPQALTSDLVGGIVNVLLDELRLLMERVWFQIRFKNALSAIAGLFRYREIEPFALLASRDQTAQQLRQHLNEVDVLLVRHRRNVSFCEEKRKLVALICDYFDGSGDPNILIRIEELDEEGMREQD